jgi:predicted dehydrogenase
MVATAERTGKMYCISQSRRWVRGWLAVCDALRGGRIGTLTTVHCDFMIGAHFGGFRAEMDHPLINDMAIHLFDGVRMMTGCDPVAVYCSEFNPVGSWYRTGASADCIFEMTDDVRFTFRGSWCSEGRHTTWEGNWRFVGTEGCILFEYDQPPVLHRATGDGFLRGCTSDPLPLPEAPYQNQHAALREFLAWLDGGPVPQGVCTDNIRSFIMTTAAAQSAETGKRVAISLR